MTELPQTFRRFDRPGTTRDFTSIQFELIQLSHEWEKLRAQVERMTDLSEEEPMPTVVEETSIPTLTLTTDQVSVTSLANDDPISDFEQDS